MTHALAAALTAASLLPGPVAKPHDVDVTSVARVFIDEVEPLRYALSIVDARVPPIRDPAAVLPDVCAPAPIEVDGIEVVSGFVFECDRTLDRGDVLVLPWRLAGVVVLASWHDGTGETAYFRGRGGSVEVAINDLLSGSGRVLGIAGTYLALGTEHILLGIDHLLFVLGLLMLVRGVWPLVKTVTAFTIAHSITLAPAVFGLVPLQRGAIEAAIALSIVLLAREIVVAERGVLHLTHHKPWLVAFTFGLLHGLGFAGALGEIGLPEQAIPVALLFFNVGVEVGQLLFIAVVLGLHRLVLRSRLDEAARLRPVVGYALGALSTLWFFDRLPSIWGG